MPKSHQRWVYVVILATCQDYSFYVHRVGMRQHHRNGMWALPFTAAGKQKVYLSCAPPLLCQLNNEY